MNAVIFWAVPEMKKKLSELLKAADEFAGSRGLTVAILDAGALAGETHLRSAAFHAIRAYRNKTMRTASLGMETILYASGRRQIRDALAFSGLSDGTTALAVVVYGDGLFDKLSSEDECSLLSGLGARKSDAKIAGGRKALERLGVSVRGASAGQLDDLALELVALLDIER